MTFERQTYYDLLGVDYDATQEEIREAYERMRAAYQGSPEMLKQIKLGWAALRNKRSRAAYDRRNDIERLRRVRQRLDRPPPTLVGDQGLDVPRTVVEAGDGLGVPRTVVAAGPGEEPDLDSTEQSDDTPVEEPVLTPLVVTLSVQPLSGRSWSRELTTGEYVIGRQDEKGQNVCDICLPDPDQFVSRKHATLLIRPDGCFVRDEHSDNGTYVNGHLIPAGQVAMLSNGDQISIEGQILTLHIQQMNDE